MKRNKLILVLLFCISLLCAQTDFKKGYLIKAANDTVWGEIDSRGDKMMAEVCTFRESKNGTTAKFLPGDILGFRFENSKYFITKEVNKKKVFLEYLINGKVNIYYMRDSIGDHYFIDKDGEGFVEIPYNVETKYSNGLQYEKKTTSHIGFLNYYMQEADGLSSEINSIKIPEHISLIKLAEKYHNKVCDGTKCIIYEKKLGIKFEVELIGGALQFRIKKEPTTESTVKELLSEKRISSINGNEYPVYSIIGVMGRLLLSRDNKNRYLKVGAMYILEGSSPVLYNVPIHFEYRYPTGIVRPSVSIGYDFNLFEGIFALPSCNLGANVVLSKLFDLSLNYNLNFYSSHGIPFLANKFCSHTLYTGFRVKF